MYRRPQDNPDNTPELQDAYELKLILLDDDQLAEECNNKIWLSAYASNNPGSCFHWQADANWKECNNRGKVFIYEREWNKLYAAAGGR